MKRIILSSLVILGLVGGVAAATVAYFSDTETSTGNTFSAGSLDLKLNSGDVNVTIFSVTNANPGEVGGATWTVNNSGSIAGYLDLHNLTLTDNDNSCTEPESTGGDVTCGPAGGELSANMNVDLFVDANNTGINDGGDTTIYSGLLSGIAANYDMSLPLAASGINYIRLNWGVPTTAGNVIQSDSTQLDAVFELGQTIGQ